MKYVEALIGRETVNTMPRETLDAYRDHGHPQPRLSDDVERAAWVLERLADLGLHIDDLTQQLENEGVAKFNQPFDELLQTLERAVPRHVSHELQRAFRADDFCDLRRWRRSDLAQARPPCSICLCDRSMPERFAVIGVDRVDLSNEEYRRRLHQGVNKFSRNGKAQAARVG